MKAILEKIDLNEQSTVHAFVFSKDSFEHPWHFHPEYELTMILQSSGIRYVGNNIADFKEGDMVLLGRNLPHCWRNGEDHQGSSKSLVIQWRKEIIGDLPVFSNINTLLHKSQRGLLIHPESRASISKLMYAVLESEAVEQYVNLLKLLDHMAKQAKYDFLAGASYSYDLSTATTNRLEVVQSFVKDHYKEKIKLAVIADQLNMSEQSFSRFFSKTMNKPFFEFVNEYRVNIASRHILETDMQMAEIAYKCGYESLPFFYKQFKKFKDYTPLEFRKMYRRI
ncbi:MAG: AraC family transcriptional regulator [Cyclobacteriaceae bacterium]